MRRLTVVGVSDDGAELMLTEAAPGTGDAGLPAGGPFAVAIDEQLRAALRNDRSRLGQLQIAGGAALRPREIQARVRAGESPEQVAVDSDMPMARVIRYALPVLAEREHVAAGAQRAVLRRPGGGVALGEAVEQAVAASGRDPGELRWDARRREDGAWVVSATGPDGPAATVVYDLPTRAVTLTGDASIPALGRAEQQPGPAEEGPARSASRMAVGGPRRMRPTLQFPEDRRSGSATDRPTVDEPTVDVPFGGRPPVLVGSGTSGRAGDGLDRDGSAADLVDAVAAADVPGGRAASVESTAEVSGGRTGSARRPPRGARRPAIPSWDEIMFGRRAD